MLQYNYLPEGMLINNEQNRKNISSLQGILRACAEGTILEAPAVLCDQAHNLIVDLGEISGIIPRNEAAIGIEDGTTREIAIISRVGRPVCFKVLRVDEDENGKKTAVLSRKAAQEVALEYFINNLHIGDIIKAKVTHLEPFGAFVDIGCGIISLIGIENISVSRITHPSDRFSVGQEIFAAVLQIDKAINRITLTHKELLGTWKENADNFYVGETVTGIVRDIPEYGVFVELAPNISGLAERRGDLKTGQKISVYIKSIIPERMKIKLIIIDAVENLGEKSQIRYYIPESMNLKRWIYTPEECQSKIIRTDFA